jgi:multimeric flavodoxin WrbA/putative sterol carrier protein
MLHILIKNLPFAGLIFINAFSAANNAGGPMLKPVLLVVCAGLIVNLLVAVRLKISTYFMLGITGMVILGTLTVFFNPPVGQIFLKHAIASLYLALFIVAFVPPLLGMDPFTYVFSKKDYPEVVWPTREFKIINLILNYIWAALFAGSMLLTLITYSDNMVLQQILQNVVPISMLLGIGYPITKFLPNYLRQKMGVDTIRFTSIGEMFAAMPYGLNKKKAAEKDVTIQFHITGDEVINGFFTIRDEKCTYTEGEYENPNMTINTPAKVWLDVSNGDLPGEKAFLNKMYTVEGDATLLMEFNELFSNSEKETASELNTQPSVKSDSDYFTYGHFEPGSIKKVLVINGGGRNEKYSKSTLMARKFCEGIEAAGGEIEIVNLRNKLIKNCCGCFNCFTKTPGVCTYKDDMPELLVKTRQADLVVYISPLFIFSVTGRLKTFLDRSIPNLMPYMMEKDGYTIHPNRYQDEGQKGFVIFSAAGFPEVEGNFDGMSALFRNMSDHSETRVLTGEFYLPAAEMISQPVYKQRRNMIEETCFEAGRQIAEQGGIDVALMKKIQDPGVTQDQFSTYANTFWESLDGKQAFYKGTDQL